MSSSIYSKNLSIKLVFLMGLVCLGIFSCRKFDGEKPFLSPSTVSAGELKVSQKEIYDWFRANLPLYADESSKALLNIQWNKAQHTTINGRQVVKIPHLPGQFWLFYKSNAQASLRVYKYIIVDEKPGEKDFTGKVYWFNFRSYEFRGVQYTAGSASDIQIFKFLNPDDLQTLRGGPDPKEKNAGHRVFAPMTRSRWGALMDTINWYLTWGGEGIFTVNFKADELQYGFSGFSPYENDFSGPEILNMYETLGSGTYSWQDYNPEAAAEDLGGALNLTNTEIDWLIGPYAPSGFLSKLYDYIYTPTTQLDYYPMLKAASAHVKLMVSNGDYRDFVSSYTGGSPNTFWWEDMSFLQVPSNVDLIVNGTTNYFEALGFYDDPDNADPGDPDPTQPPAPSNHFHHLENPLELGGFNNNVAITFDRPVNNEPVHDALTEGLRNSIINVNTNMPFPIAPIRHLNISSTSESSIISPSHSSTSNHYTGYALDFNQINRIPVVLIPKNHPYIKNLQLAFEQDMNRHENYGKYLKHHKGVPRAVGGHIRHIHFAVRP